MGTARSKLEGGDDPNRPQRAGTDSLNSTAELLHHDAASAAVDSLALSTCKPSPSPAAPTVAEETQGKLITEREAEGPGSPSFRYYFVQAAATKVSTQDGPPVGDGEVLEKQKVQEESCEVEGVLVCSHFCEGSACKLPPRKDKGGRYNPWRKGSNAVVNFLVSRNCYSSKNVQHNSAQARISPQPLCERE